MSEKQRDELMAQIEIFLSMGLLSLLAAALCWHGQAKGGWGSDIEWYGRLAASLLLVVGVPWLLHRKLRWSQSIFIMIIALSVQWIAYVIAAIKMPYLFFLVVAGFLLVYSVSMCIYLVWSQRTEKKSDFIDRVIQFVIGARKVAWLTVLWAGTITTWIEIKNHVTGYWPDIVLIICILVVVMLSIYEFLWFRPRRANLLHIIIPTIVSKKRIHARKIRPSK
jgi:hypothetical protein